MVFITLYKMLVKQKSAGKSEKTPGMPRQCQHQRNTSFNSDVELTSALNKTFLALSSFNGPNLHKRSESYAAIDTVSCDVCKDEKRATSKYRWKLMAGLFFPFWTQTLDSTMIAGAVSFIASDFTQYSRAHILYYTDTCTDQLGQLNWIVSAFNLTSAAFIPFWSQFADVFGRYASSQIALIFMIIGSTLCATAPVTAFSMLLAGRGLQGIGCAGLLIITKIILADKVSLEENAKNNTAFTIVGGVGYSIGPTLGGHLTQVSWRWCFIINIPLGVAGLELVHFVLRSELLGSLLVSRADGEAAPDISQTFKARLASFDIGGQVLFLLGMELFVLAVTWGGSYYSWIDIKVIIPLILGVFLFFGFLIWEYLMLPGHQMSNRFPTQKAMIPFKLLGTRNVGLPIYINICTGMAMSAVYYFADKYIVLVEDFTAGKVGTSLIYYMPGLGAGAYLALVMCGIWPRQTFFPLFIGTVIEPLGITIIAVAIKSSNTNLVYGMLALTGVGTGIRFMPGTLHGIGYFPDQIPQIVSLMSLAVSMGGTLATTIMLNIFNNRLSSQGLSFDSSSSSTLQALNSLPAAELEYFRYAATKGIVLAFFAITAWLWLGVVASTLLGNVRIGKDGKENKIAEKGSFFWRCF